jgi:hypothetical protein
MFRIEDHPVKSGVGQYLCDIRVAYPHACTERDLSFLQHRLEIVLHFPGIISDGER